MNDLIPGVRTTGAVEYHGLDIFGPGIDPVEVPGAHRYGLPETQSFPEVHPDNVAFGARVNGYRGNIRALTENCLRKAALWDEVKDDLKKPGLALSGGQQQRLCIARALANEPEIILMDEPCSALDPIATLKIEDLMRELVKDYTIIIVTHNMQQAARVSDYTAFMLMSENGAGQVVEYQPTNEILHQPSRQEDGRLHHGRFG